MTKMTGVMTTGNNKKKVIVVEVTSDSGDVIYVDGKELKQASNVKKINYRKQIDAFLNTTEGERWLRLNRGFPFKRKTSP